MHRPISIGLLTLCLALLTNPLAICDELTVKEGFDLLECSIGRPGGISAI